ncbi:MAG: hypothetical protein RJB60_1576 [Pseudomonadota bacterium]|jgi:hypothetical protein
MPELKDALQDAFDRPDAKHSCSHFVWHAIQAYVPDQQYLVANQLLKFLERSTDWVEVDKGDSRSLAAMAKAGALIVGGADDTPNGHVIVVYPGDAKESGGYAYGSAGKTHVMRSHGVYARAMSRSLGNWPGAKSDGDKTIWDPWAGPKFDKVKLWALRSTMPKP